MSYERIEFDIEQGAELNSRNDLVRQSLLKSLKTYQGEDRIVSGKELYEELKSEVNSVVSTGVLALDKILQGGFAPGEMILISGPGGEGKTTIAATLSSYYEKQMMSPLFFEYEMGRKQFLEKYGLNIDRFYVPRKITSRHLQWLEERILEGVTKYNSRIIFIDEIHALFSLSKIRNVSLELGDVAYKLKEIALINDITVVLIAHTKMEDRTMIEDPHHDDIRDSALIVNASDTVIMVWKVPMDYKPGDKRRKYRQQISDGEVAFKTKLRVTKNRRAGEMGVAYLTKGEGSLLVEDSEISFLEEK